MKHPVKSLITAIFILGSAFGASAQAMYFNSAKTEPVTDSEAIPADSVPMAVSDSLLEAQWLDSDDIFNQPLSLPNGFFMPPIYDTYRFLTPLDINTEVHSGNPAMRWIEDNEVLNRQMTEYRQNLFINHPELVRYNLAMLPEAPQKYEVTLNPADLSISVQEVLPEPEAPTLTGEELKRRHWIRAFTASLQFSQAYVSPNWYQGGTNNLNALGHLFYNVKLNEVFHPNLLFDTTVQYKVGMNNAPEDSIHSYNLTEDLFQINTTFGIKAANRWYYSFTGQFKTQLLNNYKVNSRDLKSAFMSPGELTLGVGMTYSYTDKPKTFTFNASLAPLSYNLKTCLSSRINPENYGIEATKKTKSKFGSTAEFSMSWKIAYNINYSARVFAFSDYESFYADWDNTLAFEIIRLLTTQIYAHLRYDTLTPYDEESGKWKKLQIKEIFSIGFAYKFSSI